MKQLVMFPGKMDGVFFRNEIPYIAEQFDKIIIFTYPEIGEIYKKLQGHSIWNITLFPISPSMP